MQKNICFISIFDLTAVQYEQATRLEARGHRCYWMTTNQRWTQWLLSRGVLRGNILELVFEKEDFLGEGLKQEVIREIVEAEAKGRFTANMAMIADRFVMAKNKKNINDYVILYFYHIKYFLLENAIDMVFGETTNLNELMTVLVCEYLGIPFLYPQNLRIPSDRFFFDLGSATGSMISSGSGKAGKTAKDVMEEFHTRNTHPSYFYLHNRKAPNVQKTLLMFKNRLRGLFATKQSFTHHRFIDRLANRFWRLVNSSYLRWLYRYDELDQISGRTAFFGLHVQPEASIDVAGPYFSDQLKIIKDMRRALPFDTTLVIKEHPNFLGQKSIRFFCELKRLPNVRVVPPKTSTFDIYKRVNLVLTISGTIAYEAGILGIPAITFSQQFFNGFSSIHYCSDVAQLKPLAMRLLDDHQVDSPSDVEYMDWIIGHSYVGYWTDPYTDPSVMSLANLEALFVGFLDVVEGACLPRNFEKILDTSN